MVVVDNGNFGFNRMSPVGHMDTDKNQCLSSHSGNQQHNHHYSKQYPKCYNLNCSHIINYSKTQSPVILTRVSLLLCIFLALMGVVLNMFKEYM